MAEATVSLSPYTGMNNNPVSITDPLGLLGETSPAFNSQAPVASFYMPFLIMSNYTNQSGKKSMAGEMLESDMREASRLQQIYQVLIALGKGSSAQGTTVSPNNSRLTGNMTDGYTITGTTVKGKNPGFFGKLWGGVKRGVIGFLEAGDRLTASKGNDRSYNKDRGGFELKGSDGQNQEKRKGGDNIDEKPIEVDAMMFMFGNGGSGGPTQFARWTEIGDNMLKSFMSMHDATSQLNDVMKAYLTDKDTLINLQNKEGTSLISIPKDSLMYFRQAVYGNNGYYNSDNIVERK
jgi:hypothetical protein